jgi:DNA mismatch endonuclease, patch repair protein
MSAIRARDTKPEMLVRRALHRAGYRFRLHRRDLPGRPDLVLPKHRIAIFVHGCFWHRHLCPAFVWPKTRSEFWRAKIEGNVRRDRAARLSLRRAGWRDITIWECETRRYDGSDVIVRRVERVAAQAHLPIVSLKSSW